MPRLVNEEMKEIKDNISTYNDDLSDAVYEHYKNIVVLSDTINIKGAAADTMKKYMATVQSNIAEKIINVSAELLTAVGTVKEDFESFEGDKKGIVGDSTIKDIKKQTEDYKKTFEDATDGDKKLLEAAAEFIATTKLNTETVIDTFGSSATKLQQYKDELDEHDAASLNQLTDVKERVDSLAKQIEEVCNNYRDAKGIIPSKVDSLTKEPWYSNEMKGAFNNMAEEDPFYYGAGDASLYEGQWVTGTSDAYAQAYARGVGATGSFKMDNDSIETRGEFSAASGNVSMQSGIVGAEMSATILGGEGHFNLDGKGLDAGAEAHLASVESSVTVGNADYNGFFNGNASLGNVDANIAFNQNEIGAGAHASWARAEADAGATLGGVEISGGLSVGVQAGFGFSISTTGIEIDGALIFGLDFSLKFP
ncbi:T7SS effector LXG polymorphic toxin [Listeria seeligeri]|uniref:T7SS effector LXG polymorphic toxin n=2 Tax=Listeria seeligeri TaxID=1640 RepID=UPI001629B90B|nr:T7SS effector LXG polymorphic toxin [Listeria seeligeri]MBC1471084.1 hypothetical protein [Listeria seeligeri]MBC1869274.1 hypothetical protein [Listeria seeligeri]MBC1875783.1 hypothetical protein [Listeria seeligeri]MBC1899800.1 hypothetical protein [Listeria seeligeri]MBC2094600.1 hypothetical protein [Listeria seeligeri]